MQSVEVIAIETWGPLSYYLKFSRKFDFIPGQLIEVSLTPGGPRRLYSLASGFQDDFSAILFNIPKDAGLISRGLASLKKGDVFWTSLPFGQFHCKTGSGVWIANGTGIAPFLAMTLSGLSQEKILIQGARNFQLLYGFQIFKEKLKSCYIPFSSQESIAGIRTGRFSDYIKTELKPDHGYYYLCGSSQMITDVRDILLSRGIDFKKILSEAYF